MASRGLPEPGIAPVGYPAGAQRPGFDLILREQQGRQQESGTQDITESRCAIDGRALWLQRGDVAIQRAQADVELGC